MIKSWLTLARKSTGSIFAVSAREIIWLGGNFITIVAGTINNINVIKIAIPPPSGTVLSANLSLTGSEIKPVLRAKTFTRPVRINDKKKEPANNSIANVVSVVILTAPIVGYEQYQKNQNNTFVCNPDKYDPTAATGLYQR